MEIIGQSINEITYKALNEINTNGEKVPSRVGYCYELKDVDIYLSNPRDRLISIPERKSNPFATIAEILWVLSGETDVEYLKFFLPRAEDYSDDGITWRGGYGKRIYDFGQIDNVVECLINDKFSRQAVMTIWNPMYDTIDSLNGKPTKDIPCSQWLGFYFKNKTLYCKLQMRSNDCLWGFSHINVPEFTILTEVILNLYCNSLHNTTYYDNGYDLGTYHHSALSLHYYENIESQVKNILSNSTIGIVRSKRYKPFILPQVINNQNKLKDLFKDLHDLFLQKMRVKLNPSFYEETQDITEWIADMGIKAENNLLYDYIRLVDTYISGFEDPTVLQNLYLTMDDHTTKAIKNYMNRVNK